MLFEFKYMQFVKYPLSARSQSPLKSRNIASKIAESGKKKESFQLIPLDDCESLTLKVAWSDISKPFLQ